MVTILLDDDISTISLDQGHFGQATGGRLLVPNTAKAYAAGWRTLSTDEGIVDTLAGRPIGPVVGEGKDPEWRQSQVTLGFLIGTS